MSDPTRRQLLGSAAIASAGLLAGSMIAAADEQVKAPKNKQRPCRISVTWGKSKKTPPESPESATFTVRPGSIQNSTSVTFNNFQIAFEDDGESRTAAVEGVELSVRLPDKPAVDCDGSRLDLDFLGFRQLVRLHVSKSKDVRVVLICNLAGTTLVKEIPAGLTYGDGDGELDPDITVEFFSPWSVSPTDATPAYVPIPPYGGTLMIAAERSDAEGQAHVVVDELDVLAVFSSADKQ